MDLADLAGWTPVALRLEKPDPHVDWLDLRATPLLEPFFGKTLAGIAEPQLLRTPLGVLADLEKQCPGRDPDGFIFHLARCGSTLVSRLAAQVPGVSVYSEPEALNALLELDETQADIQVQVLCTRLLLRAFCRGRPAGDTVLIKLSSWNVRRMEVLQQAFPVMPWAFVYRDPAEVVSSLLGGPPGWMTLQGDAARAEQLFGIPAEIVEGLDEASFAVCAVGSFIGAVLGERERRPYIPALPVDYRELPQAIWQRVLPFFGVACDESLVQTLAEAASWDAKNPGRAFVPDGKAKRDALPEAVCVLINQTLMPLYDKLSAWRDNSAT